MTSNQSWCNRRVEHLVNLDHGGALAASDWPQSWTGDVVFSPGNEEGPQKHYRTGPTTYILGTTTAGRNLTARIYWV